MTDKPTTDQDQLAELRARIEKIRAKAANRPKVSPAMAAHALGEALSKGTGVIVCFETCWSCKFGECYEPAAEHPWWDAEDVDYAKEAGNPAPTGNCACPCARPTSEEPQP